MRIYFLTNNLQDLNNLFKNLYINTVEKFEERLEIYKNDALEPDCVILINELEDTLKDLNNPIFKKFFLDLGTEIFEQIRYASVSNHTDKCIIRAIFDIIFKYCIDFEFKIPHLCCNNNKFKLLQLEILRDLRYKIKLSHTIPTLIRNQNQNLKI